MAVTVIPNSLWDLQVGDEVVVRDSYGGWNRRYQLTTVTTTTKTTITIPWGTIYRRTSGKPIGRFATVDDQLYLPEDRVEFNGSLVTARVAVELHVALEKDARLKAAYALYIVEQGYTRLIKRDVATLKQVGELLGYKDVEGS